MARAAATTASDSSRPTLSAASRFVVLSGKDRFLQDEYLRTLREALAKAHGAEGFDTVRFDGAQGARILADAMDECRSFGLMQQHKIVLIDNAELLFKGEEEGESRPDAKSLGKKGGHRAPGPLAPRDILIAYAEGPTDSATLVLRAGIWRPSNLDKAIAAMPAGAGAIIKCEAPSLDDAAAWAVKRCKARHNSTIDAGAARTLVETTGVDLGRIDGELEKLALAAGGDGSPITAALIEQLTGVTRQEEFFAIQGSLLSGDAGRALSHLRELIEVSRQDPVPIGWAYIEAARKLHLAAHGAKAGKNVFSMQYQLKVFGPGANEMLTGLARMAKVVSPGAAARLLNAAVRMDAGNKSGLGDPVRNLEILAVKFSEAGA